MNSLLATLARATFGSVTSVLSSTFARATSFAGTLFGSLMQRIVGFFVALPGQILNALSGLGRTVLSLFGGALKGALYAVAGAIGGIVALTSKAVQSLTAFGRSVSYLSASTGLSNRSAASTQRTLGAFGIDASETFAGRDPALYAMRAGVYGVKGYDQPGFLAGAAGRFQNLQQGGITGRQLAQQLASTLGLNNPAGLRALSTPVGQIREQEGYTNRVGKAFGIDGSAIVRVTRDWDRFSARLRMFGETVLLKIGQSVLPRLNAGLEVLAGLAKKSAGGLSGFIDKAINGAFEGMAKFADFLWKTLPEAALNFATLFLKGLLAITDALPTLWTAFLKGLDIIQSIAPPLMDWLAQNVPKIFEFAVNGFNGLVAGVQQFVAEIPNVSKAITDALNSIASNPLVAGVINQVVNGNPIVNGAIGVAGSVGSTVIGAALPPLWAAFTSGGLPAVGAAISTAAAPVIAGVGGALAAGGAAAAGLVGAAGTVIGGGLYSAGASIFGDKDTPGFINAASNTKTRIANVLTGRDNFMSLFGGPESGYGVSQIGGGYGGMAPTGLAAIQNSVNNVTNAATNAFNGTGTGGGLNLTSNPLAGLLTNIPQGSLSRGLDGALGGTVRDSSRSQGLQGLLQQLEGMKEGVAERGNLQDILKSIDSKVGTTNELLSGQASAEQDQKQWQALARIVGQSLTGAAKSEFIRTVSG